MRLAHNGQIVSFRTHLQSNSQMKYKRGKKKKGPGISTWAFPLESPSKNQILAKWTSL